jgi:UDP-N-acetyl-D-mannosaminuronic acid transferase (WecB/TagA/CpsF family)
MKFPTFDMLGIRVQALTIHDLLAIISEAIQNEAKYLVTNLNMHSLYMVCIAIRRYAIITSGLTSRTSMGYR